MQPAPLTPADRLSALIVRFVCAMFARRVGAHLGFVPGPLLALIADRLRQVSQRFRRLADRVRAGWVYQPKPRAPRSPAEPPADKPLREPREPPDPSLALIHQVWLIPGDDVETVKREFQQLLLTDPEMQAVMAAAPGPAWRILRPLCRMIGMPRPDILTPPPRPKAEKPPRPRPSGKDDFGWLEQREYSFAAHWPRGVPRPRTA